MKKSAPARKPRPKALAKKNAVAKTDPAPLPVGAKPHIPDGHFLLLGDCLDAMTELRDERGFREQVDLIYLDPPFNSKAAYSFVFGEKVAAKSAVIAFRDTWSWKAAESAYDEYTRSGSRGARFLQSIRGALGTTRDGLAMLSYLTMMTPRLELMRDLLKPDGSIYLHCDHSAGHYLKVVMDSLFGRENFRNEIAWCYPPKGRGPKLGFHSKHDTILFYGKSRSRGVFHRPFTELDERQRAKFSKMDRDGRRFKEFKGRRTYLDEVEGRPTPSWWTDIAATAQSRTEYLGYPTQKPLALLRRIVEASSDPGGLVMDPYCGCGTTLAACRETGRDFVGIDIEPFAAKTIKARMSDEMEVRVGHVQPKTEADFARLVESGRYREFQYHAINLIGGAFPNPKHSGDQGIDGWIFVRRQGMRKSEAIVISVKAGANLSPAMVRELRGVLERGLEGRGPRPLGGVLITMGEPTPGMLTEAESAGQIEDGELKIPRIQILPIRRLLEGRYRLPRVVGVKGLAGEFRGLYAGL